MATVAEADSQDGSIDNPELVDPLPWVTVEDLEKRVEKLRMDNKLRLVETEMFEQYLKMRQHEEGMQDENKKESLNPGSNNNMEPTPPRPSSPTTSLRRRTTQRRTMRSKGTQKSKVVRSLNASQKVSILSKKLQTTEDLIQRQLTVYEDQLQNISSEEQALREEQEDVENRMAMFTRYIAGLRKRRAMEGSIATPVVDLQIHTETLVQRFLAEKKELEVKIERFKHRRTHMKVSLQKATKALERIYKDEVIGSETDYKRLEIQKEELKQKYADLNTALLADKAFLNDLTSVLRSTTTKVKNLEATALELEQNRRGKLEAIKVAENDTSVMLKKNNVFRTRNAILQKNIEDFAAPPVLNFVELTRDIQDHQNQITRWKQRVSVKEGTLANVKKTWNGFTSSQRSQQSGRTRNRPSQSQSFRLPDILQTLQIS